MRKTASFLVGCVALLPVFSQAKYDKIQSDTWVCNDGLNRVVASSDQGVQQKDIDTACVVGMFYYIWHGQHGEEVKDITRILEKNVNNPQWGSENQFHWGSKPVLGYYSGGDPFVVAKHMQMLMDAGIDFYFFDVTNAYTYDGNVRVVMDEIDRRESLGLKTPKLVFMTHTGSNNVVNYLYNLYYANSKYDKYWFYWNGKPLILTNKDEYESLDSKLKEAFTHRFSWAWDPGENKWPWLAYYPQKVNYTIDDATGAQIPEQITVGVAQHPYSKVGKSYHSGAEPAYDAYGLSKYTPYGYYFKEQWTQAIKKHPKVVMVTQWNEWMAQRFIIKENGQLGHVRPGATAKIGETYFVDVYNQEFSRDCEPCADSLIRDNYYLQLVSYMRQYKGVNTIPVPTVSKTIDLKNGFSQWEDVTTGYYDEPGDTYYTSTVQAAESRKRESNDIVCCKVTKDEENLYFYVEVNNAQLVGQTASKKERWMTLLLNTNLVYKDGWEGYDYMVSADAEKDGMVLYRYDASSSAWIPVKAVSYQCEANKLMLQIAKSDLAMASDVDFDFKWIDNVPASSAEILDFIVNGEAAPNGRFNYRYKGSLLKSVPVGISRNSAQADDGIKVGYTDGSIRITSTGAEGNVYDMSGRIVACFKDSLLKKIPVGAYIIKYKQGNSQKTLKYICS